MRHLLLSLLIGLLLPALAAVGAEPTLHRWAVIASNSVLESGLPDLLTVELSQDDSIQLVERERLRDATRELELATLMKAESIDQRLLLGKTLGADALMVLSDERHDGKQSLKVVVCDAKLGVRLWDERFVDEGSDIAVLVEKCASLVPEVRTRFASGIQRIIAVPPFLSENFEQRFDYLQSRQSNVLSSALMTRPGVAIVEIEEAQAVLRELQGTLSDGLKRPIATIVKGKYRVSPLDEEQKRTITVQIELVSSDDRHEVIDKTVEVGMVGHWLRDHLANHLVDTSNAGSPALSSKAQTAILSRLADQFAKLGDWERSISLREAALVLGPNDAVQRGLLISEYQFSIAPAIQVNWHPARFAKKLPPAPRAEALQRAADDYVEALNHLEYLVRNKLITRADAIGLFYTHCWYLRGAVGPALPFDADKHAALQPACVAQRAFLHEIGAEFDKLSPGHVLPERLSTPFYGLQYTLTQHVLSDVVFNSYSPESLESLRDVVERIVPDDTEVSASVLSYMQRSFASEQRLDLDAYHEELRAQRPSQWQAIGPRERKARDEWRTYLRLLTQSDRPVVKLYGYWGLLQMTKDPQSADRAGGESLVELIAAVESQLAEVKRLRRIGSPAQTQIESGLAMTKKRIETLAASPRPPAVVSEPPTPPSPTANPLGRMRLEPIDLVVGGEQDAGEPPLIKGMIQCGERCDAYWTQDRFFVMHEPGVLRELKLADHKSENDLFQEVAWDGECIWLYAGGQGVIAVRPDGTRLATFNQTEHLPGYWKGFKLLGLSPRKALIAASFGDTNRGWCGILQIDEQGKQSANIFFEAKNVPEGRTPEEAAADPRTAFQPEGLQQVRHTNGTEYVVVERRELGYLLIDLETLEVSVAKSLNEIGRASTRTDLGYSGEKFLHDGRYVSALSGLASLPYSKTLFHDGWLYRPGYVWMREETHTGKRERLQQNTLPQRYWNLRIGASAHYGLVTFDPYDRSLPLSKITIEELPQVPGEE